MSLRTPIPSNLLRLWAAGDRFMDWSAEMIAEETYLHEHLDLIETSMDCIEMIRITDVESERHTAMAGLLVRCFDGLSSGTRAALTGHYSACAMFCRDLLETAFLLDYFTRCPGQEEEWLAVKTEKPPSKFQAPQVRNWLDKQDGFKEKKREKHYHRLSNLGAHATPASFHLRRDGMQSVNVAPFKNKRLLAECIEELAKISIILGPSILTYCRSLPAGAHKASKLSLTLQKYRETHLAELTSLPQSTGEEP